MTALAIGMLIVGGMLGFFLAAAITLSKHAELEQELWTLRRRLYRLDPEEHA